MARNPHEEDSMSLRWLLATRPKFSDLSRMSDAQVRRHVTRFRSDGKLPAAHQSTPLTWARPNVQAETASQAPAVAAVAAITEEKRYLLLVALAYHTPQTLCTNKVLTPRFKWQNEATGPETRRSGEIKPGDPAFNALRCREMREGNYHLEFQSAMLETLPIKTARN